MGIKKTFTPVAGAFATVARINAILVELEAELDKCVYRDGTPDSELTASLDANSNRLINLAPGTGGADAVTVQQLQDASIVTDIPTQTGNANTFLQTDGTLLSWNSLVTLVGSLTIDNLLLDGNTISSIVGDINLTPIAGSKVYLDSLISADGGTLTITGNLAVDNLDLNGNTLSSTNTNGDINLTPNGTGSVVFVAPASFTSLDVDNLNLNGNTVSSTDTNGDIILAPDGTGDVTIGGSRVAVIADTLGVVAGTPYTLSPYATNTSATTAHGLGESPACIKARLVCTTADKNWPIGAEIDLSAGRVTGNSAGDGLTIGCDGTNVYVVTDSAISFTIHDKTTNLESTITAASWDLVVTPYAFTTLT